MTTLGILAVLRRYGVRFVNFEHDVWIPMEVNSHHWRSFHVPRTIYEADKRVYLATMHCGASRRMAAALELAVGWTDERDRTFLASDADQVEEAIAELHLGWQPDVVLLDGRRSTSAWRREYIYPNVIMASGDMVAIDTEAVRTLRAFQGHNQLNGPIEGFGQLRAAQEYGLGSVDYTLVEAPAHTSAIQDRLLDVPMKW